MKPSYACNSCEHDVSRRSFLAGAMGTAGMLGFGSFLHPALAQHLARHEKRVLLIFLSGGVSQLETWDPKPGTATGGPFRAINTNVTGIQISELLPHTAQHMNKMALVRGINTAENEHGRGAYMMQTGRRQNPAEQYPHLGSVMAKLLSNQNNPLPGYIHVTPSGGSGFNRQDAAFLGPQYASVTLADGNPPANLLPPANQSAPLHAQGMNVLNQLNGHFQEGRRTAETSAYTSSYEQAAEVIRQGHVFDIQREPASIRDQYGAHDFGRHCLLARRLLENGVTFAKVTHSNYDTHYENFEFHIEQLGEFDRTFATLLSDLEVRGLLERTLVIVMSEFGRTPNINRGLGRDHWSAAWSVALAGCGIRGGTAVGRTNAGGTAVVERQVNAGHLFHTYFRALGLDPTRNHYVDNRPIPMADPAASAIQEVLA
jgi:uncharacterized protein (DUF1501 family)